MARSWDVRMLPEVCIIMALTLSALCVLPIHRPTPCCGAPGVVRQPNENCRNEQRVLPALSLPPHHPPFFAAHRGRYGLRRAPPTRNSVPITNTHVSGFVALKSLHARATATRISASAIIWVCSMIRIPLNVTRLPMPVPNRTMQREPSTDGAGDGRREHPRPEINTRGWAAGTCRLPAPAQPPTSAINPRTGTGTITSPASGVPGSAPRLRSHRVGSTSGVSV